MWWLSETTAHTKHSVFSLPPPPTTEDDVTTAEGEEEEDMSAPPVVDCACSSFITAVAVLPWLEAGGLGSPLELEDEDAASEATSNSPLVFLIARRSGGISRHFSVGQPLAQPLPVVYDT